MEKIPVLFHTKILILLHKFGLKTTCCDEGGGCVYCWWKEINAANVKFG